MHLCSDTVVLVLDDVRRGEALLDLLELQDRRREHHPDRKEMGERGLGERSVLRSQRRLADVAGQHVRPSDLFAIASERAGDRLLEQTLSQADAGFAAHDLYDVAGLAGGGSRDRRTEQIAFRRDATGGGDRVEGLRDVGEREPISGGGTLRYEVCGHVAECAPAHR